VEDNVTGYFVVGENIALFTRKAYPTGCPTEWETVEHHRNIMKQESYREVMKSINPLFTGEFKMEHIPLDKSPMAALSAPVTEVTVVTLKPGRSKAELMAAIVLAAAEGSKLRGLYFPIVYGCPVENENKVVALLGWDSVQVGNLFQHDRIGFQF
jgi:hypothetical protein